MVDVNQQWDCEMVICMGCKMEQFNFIWIEELLDVYDIEGYVQFVVVLDMFIVIGEMLISFWEYEQLILGNVSDFVQLDVLCVGGIFLFLKIMDLVVKYGCKLVLYFVMEVYLYFFVVYFLELWLEYFEWLNLLFNE